MQKYSGKEISKGRAKQRQGQEKDRLTRVVYTYGKEVKDSVIAMC
jgi:hypothetical protein